MYCETYVGVTVVDQLGGVGAAGAAAAGAAVAGAAGAAIAGIAGGVAGATWAWAEIARAINADRQMAMTVLFMLCLMGSGFSRG